MRNKNNSVVEMMDAAVWDSRSAPAICLKEDRLRGIEVCVCGEGGGATKPCLSENVGQITNKHHEVLGKSFQLASQLSPLRKQCSKDY